MVVVFVCGGVRRVCACGMKNHWAWWCGDLVWCMCAGASWCVEVLVCVADQQCQVKHVQFRKHRWVSLVLRTERDGNPFTVGCESAEGGEERASVRLRLGCAGPSHLLRPGQGHTAATTRSPHSFTPLGEERALGSGEFLILSKGMLAKLFNLVQRLTE